MQNAKRIVVLGSTGSIGENTLRIVDECPGLFRVVGLAAGSNAERVAEQAARYGVRRIALADAAAASRAAALLPDGAAALSGRDGVCERAADPGADVVVCAMVGRAALKPVLAAIDAGHDVAIATKEVLVAAGALVTARAREKGVNLLPVDSEHSAVFQALADARRLPACVRGRAGAAGPGPREPADTTMTPFAEQGAVDLGIPLYLFAYNNAGTATGKAKAKLHELKILRSDGNDGFSVVRHYLPARKGGVAGLYDKATGKFYGSATATPFNAPSTALPRPAKTLAWVQSDGDDGSRRLWLDTGVIAKSGIRSDIDFTLKDTPTASNERGILTARGAANSNTRFYLAYHYHGNFIYGYKTFFDSSVTAEKDGRYRIVGALDEGAQSVTVNDAELNSGASTSTGYLNAGNTLALFCYRDSSGTSYHSAIRLYSLKLWDGDEALRDYVPCLADNGQAGLYDRVTKRVFFPVAKNAGATSAFYLDSEVGVAETETVSAITVDWTYGAMLLGAQIAASGVLDLANAPADAKLGGATIPVTLHQTTDAANFGTWTLRVNGVASDYRLYWNGSALRIPGTLVMSVW